MEGFVTHKEYAQANIRLEQLIDLVDHSIPQTDPLAI